MSPKAKARLSGALYLATIVGGIVAQAFIGDRLVVTGDAAATARNILANPMLIRVAYAIFMLGVCLLACVVPTRRALSVEPTVALRVD